MARLDELMPDFDVVERHERHVPASPADAVAAALASPVAPDGLVRALFRLRGLPRGGTVYGAIRALGFSELVREPDWRAVGPFSGFIRTRWLAAAARALR